MQLEMSRFEFEQKIQFLNIQIQSIIYQNLHFVSLLAYHTISINFRYEYNTL